MVLGQKFKTHPEVQAVNQAFSHILYRIHDHGIRNNGNLDVAQEDAVVLARQGILVRLVKSLHFLLGRADGAHVHLAHAGNFHVAADLLRKLVAVLGHADTELGADSLL